jgi:hypothetical protein
VIQNQDQVKIASIGDFGLKWGDERKALEEIEKPLFIAIGLALKRDYAIEAFKKRNEKWAEGFWNDGEKGPPVENLPGRN